MIRVVAAVASLVTAAYIALCVAARLAYRRLLYPAPRVVLPASLPEGAKRIVVHGLDGAEDHAVWLPGHGAATRTIVLFHGNGETIENSYPLADALNRRHLGVVLAEYRGYGVSAAAGPPSEAGLYGDAAAVLESLASQGVGPHQVVLLGISLGTGVAAEMARRGKGAALVLVSPYTSVTAMAERIAPLLPAAFVCPDRFDTIDKAASIRVPTLVVHGDADEVIPFEMGRAVAGAIPAAVLHTVKGGHHNDLFAAGSDTLVERIAAHAFAAK